MASILSNSFVYLREINPALDQYKIKVRVVRLWRLFKSIEMVLVDGEGTRVHASIEEGLGKRFQHQFVSGESRIIDTFSFVYYDDVLGQIVDVGSLDSIKAKGKDTVKLSAGSEDLIHVDSKNKTSHSAVTLYEEFFQLNEKKTVEDIVYACDVSTCVTIARVCFIETMPKWYYIACKAHGDAGPICSCGVCDADATDLILRASYGASPEVKLLFFDGLAQCLIGKTAAEFFAEVPKELTVVSDSACDIINPKIEMIESSVVDDSPSTDKRIFDDVKSKPVTGKKMVTRKKAKALDFNQNYRSGGGGVIVAVHGWWKVDRYFDGKKNVQICTFGALSIVFPDPNIPQADELREMIAMDVSENSE
ncbi:Nucleic acid-binding OB-fold [Arabidopsis thaliana x Arabidopsis arenosa]|uniref:Nucleic acid-binding OB-fold n=1 Tax=Arabidopsis thaliana x Arabidopsis arenosa TaxID=1240361 RepID=A0A8T2GMW9_9BRAS|nr:Nucleic acid-binding OB-fold [Arabidopsis thaliana x Arabidopsis arenosa]